MFCKQCGNRLEEGARFCNSCGATVVPENNMNQVNNQPVNNQPMYNNGNVAANEGNTKIYKILAYIGILFVVGMFVKEKDDKSVRFHVGQGIMVFILDAIVGVINGFIVPAIFKKEVTVWGIPTGTYTVSGIGVAIMWILWVAVAAFSIMGIVNAVKGEDKKLPVIGDLAFYK